MANAIVEQARIVVGAAVNSSANPMSSSRQVTTDALKPDIRSSSGHWPTRMRSTGCLRVLRQITALHRSRALPLMVKSRPVGVLEFRFSAPVNFDDECQTLLVSVAQHCARHWIAPGSTSRPSVRDRTPSAPIG